MKGRMIRGLRRTAGRGRVAARKSIRAPAVLADLLRSKFVTPATLVKKEIPGDKPLSSEKRLCVFSHFDKHSLVDPYVIHYLSALHDAGCATVFVSTCRKLDEEEVAKVTPFATKVILRKNIGRDFGSWKVGLGHAGDLSGFEQIVLANDSVYGPIFDLGNAFAKMADKNFDLWGITDSREHAYHAQSYFLVFDARAVRSAFFERFWNGYRFVSDKYLIIKRYELGLSGLAQQHGYQVGALCGYGDVYDEALNNVSADPETAKFIRSVQTRAVNPSHFFWRTLIERFECPFLKVELLRDNPFRIPDIKYWPKIVTRFSNYDPTLIANHLRRVS